MNEMKRTKTIETCFVFFFCKYFYYVKKEKKKKKKKHAYISNDQIINLRKNNLFKIKIWSLFGYE